MDVPSIPQFFKNKEILITGASGFVGKALLETILRCCPDFKVIYLLLRPKKGVKPEDRIEKILEDGLFDVVREKNPEVFNKLTAISGDVSELKLGLSSEDRACVLGVHVVFHVAASVRFDDSLKKATLMNTRGTREVMELMLEMSCLEVGVHVSTTYCNTDKDVIEERVYRDHGDWREAIRAAEKFGDEHKLACLTEKITGKLQNTYTYTKHLSENVVEDYSDRLPLVLFRPGVVISTWKDPIPGWNNSVYGPMGFGMAAGKGVLRTFFMGRDVLQDYMPVDMVVKSMLIATWQRAIQPSLNKRLPTYNCSVQGRIYQTNDECGKSGVRACKIYPYNGIMWYPVMEICENETDFRARFILKHVLPGILMDAILKISGKKPMLMRLFRQMFYACLLTSVFAFRNWDFKSDKMWELVSKLKPEDKQNFAYSFDGYEMDHYLEKLVIGSKKYILKEPLDYDKARLRLKRFAILHYTLLTILYAAIIYAVWNSNWMAQIWKLFG